MFNNNLIIFILFFILFSNLINSFNNSDNELKQINSKILFECKDPLINLFKWECKINNKEEEKEEEKYLKENLENILINNGSKEEEEKENKLKINLIPLEFYYSIKTNRSNGQLFISAILRCEFIFISQIFNYYKIFIYIEEINNNINNSNKNNFTLTAIPSFLNNSSLINTQQRLELMIQLDDYFNFKYSYKIKIISFPLLQRKLNEEFDIKNFKFNFEQKEIFITYDKQINFDELPEEFDSDICHQTENNINEHNLILWKKRKEIASRWTGAFHSIIFYPLNSAIKISFYGAPPSFCINNYRIQLWLLNSLLQEKIIKLSSLIQESKSIFIGFVEFKNLLSSDTRLKYKIHLIPIEKRENDEKCICELNNKCGCVEVISDWFTMPNISSISSFNNNSNNIQKNYLLLNNTKIITKLNNENNGLFSFILICLFLSLTFILLTFAILLFILNKFNCLTTKKRQTWIIRKKLKEDVVLLPSNIKTNNVTSITTKNSNIYSVLLANAQPSRSGDLERFARLLVKNGVRIFYDRWDKTSIERNLFFWVHQATTKSDKAVFFWDKRAEQLVNPNKLNESINTTDIFDRVFCALHQQMNPEKTIFVNWDDSDFDLKPFGCIGENKPFIFSKDLSLIYTALKVPASEADIHKFSRLNLIPSLIPSSTTPSLAVFIPSNKQQKNYINKIIKNKNNYLINNNININKEFISLTIKNNENKKENLHNNQSINNQTINKLEEEKQLSAFDSGIDSSSVIAL